MSKQYFTNNPELAHQEREIAYRMNNQALKLQTDSGVFSKNQVDYGSNVLVETILEHLNKENVQQLVELGSGYGPVALMLAKCLPHAKVTGVEINERAWQLSKLNADKNSITNIEFVLADGTDSHLKVDADLVVTNPPIRAGKQVVHAFVDEAYRLLKPNGELYVVIQKKQGAPSMEKKMKSLFTEVEKITQDKGYWILRGVK